MTDPGETSRLLDLVRLGDERARNELLAHVGERLRLLTGRMLRSFPGVAKWEETDDVLQNAIIRLCRSLEAAHPESARHFYNLAALQIRRELIDLARHYNGARESHIQEHYEHTGMRNVSSAEPASLEEWTAFHKAVAALPNIERELFDLIWYEGLSQEQAASVLAVSVRTAKRRWQSARLRLIDSLNGEKPH